MGKNFYKVDLDIDTDYIWELYNNNLDKFVTYKDVDGKEISEIQRLDLDLLKDSYLEKVSDQFENADGNSTVFAKIVWVAANYDAPAKTERPVESSKKPRGAALILPLQPFPLSEMVYYDEHSNEVERVTIDQPTVCNMASIHKAAPETVDRITFELSIYQNFDETAYVKPNNSSK
jgi:hypothetical protein